MLKKSDFIRLAGKSADMVTKELKEIGKGKMGAAPIKIWDSATLSTRLKDMAIFGVFEIIQICIWGIPKIKQKMDESKRIHDIINDDEDEVNTENETDNMEEQS